MTERQPQVLQVGVVDDPPVFGSRALVDPGCVVEPYPLRLSRRPGRVDEGGEGVAIGGCDGLVDGPGVLFQQFRADQLQLCVGDDPVVQLHVGGVDDDDGVDALLQDGTGLHLGQLGSVLDHRDAGSRVLQDELHVTRSGVRIDRRGGPGRTGHGQVEQDPLEPGCGDDPHPLFPGQPSGQQTGSQLIDQSPRLSPGVPGPGVRAFRCTVRVQKGQTVGGLGHPTAEHVADRTGKAEQFFLKTHQTLLRDTALRA